MINANFELLSIDYEQTVDNLLARFREDVHSRKAGFRDRFLEQAAILLMPLAKKLYRSLKPASRARFVQWILNRNSRAIRDAINSGLQADPLSKNFRIGRVSFTVAKKGILLHAIGINVDYHGLLDVPIIKKNLEKAARDTVNGHSVGRALHLDRFLKTYTDTLAHVAVIAAPGHIEKWGIGFVNSPEIRSEIRKGIDAALRQEKLIMRCGRIRIYEETLADKIKKEKEHLREELSARG